MVVSLLNQYSKPLFVMTWLRRFSQMQNSRGNRASPQYMLQLMLTWAIDHELASRCVLMCFHLLLSNVRNLTRGLI